MMAEYIDREKATHAARYTTPMMPSQSLAIVNAIESIPAADVRPVVRGKWIGNKRHQSCSACGMTYCVPDGEVGALDMTHYNFCPNCGADMREES